MADSVSPVYGDPAALRLSKTCASAVTAGRLVQLATGTDTVEHAGANSLKVVGVAMHDVPAARATIQGPQVGDGHELTVISGVVIPVSFVGASAVGDRLVAAANGEVAVVTATSATYVQAEAIQTRAIVGYTFQAVAGAGVGLAFIKHGGSG